MLASHNDNENLRRLLVRGGVGSVLVRVASLLIGLLSVAILARILGPEQYGIYAYVIVLVSLVSIPMHPGLSQLVVRETARGLAASDWPIIRGVWRWAITSTLGLSCLIVIVSAGIAFAFRNQIDGHAIRTLMGGLVLMPIVVLIAIFGSAVRGLGHVVAGLIGEQILRNSLLVVLVIAFVLVASAQELDATSAMVINVLASSIALFLGASILRAYRPGQIGRTHERKLRIQAWTAAAWPLAFVASMQIINQHADIIMLGIFQSSREVGIYKVVVSGAMLVVFGLQAVNTVVAPYFAKLHKTNDERRLQKLVSASSMASLAMSLPIVIVFIVFGEIILRTVFGTEYVLGYLPLAILSIGQLANSFFGPVGYLLNMTGHERDTARGVAIAAACNILLNLTLIPKYAMSGAAAATAISLSVWNVLLWRSARMRLGINTLALSTRILRRNEDKRILP